MLLDSIREDLINNLDDALKKNAKNLVFGKGNPHAKIFFIGEAPGSKEDELGEPFVGSSGKELDKLLKSINLSLEDVYIANILKYRPPNNRNPTKEEIATHTPYLIKQIKEIKPLVICPLGNYATKFVLSSFSVEGMNKVEGITNIHGKLKKIKFKDFEFLVFPFYHPAAILYNPKLRIVMSEDFISLKKVLIAL
jgi:DNA polymerase